MTDQAGVSHLKSKDTPVTPIEATRLGSTAFSFATTTSQSRTIRGISPEAVRPSREAMP